MATAITPSTATRRVRAETASEPVAPASEPRVLDAPVRRRRERAIARGGRDRIERTLVFLVPFALFTAVGRHMVVVAHAAPGDALSRTANAAAAVFSRDPHLEAIGFVWPPIPQLVEVPLVWFGRWFPSLLRDGFAGVIASALFMAAMVSAVRTWLAECGLRRSTRLALLALLVIQPMVLLYGANGMSDAAMLAFLVIGARRLARWFEDERPLDLTAASIALGCAYLTRYEVAASIMAVTSLVGWVAYGRLRVRHPELGPRRLLRKAAIPMSVAALPATFSVVLWAFVSWAVVDEPFAQFTSAYGNSRQVADGARGIALMAGAASGPLRARFFGLQVLVFGVVAVVAMIAILWFARRGALRMWAAVACLAAPLGFLLVSSVGGSIFAWPRYAIAIVPLGTMLLGTLIASVGRVGTRHAVAAGLALILSVVGVAVQYRVIRHEELGTSDEARQLATLPRPVGGFVTPEAEPSAMPWGQHIAAEIERLAVHRGQILTDAAHSFSIILASRDETDFVIPSDRDFSQVLADPVRFGARYVLVPDPAKSGYDQVNDTYPGLYRDGFGMAHLVAEWPAGKMTFRLYEMNNWADAPAGTGGDGGGRAVSTR
jgi:hypothetical protein